MTTEFSVRERILLCLRDETTEAPVKQIAKWIGATEQAVSSRLSEMYVEGLTFSRHSGSHANPVLYSLTNKGRELAGTQAWRMKMVGKKSISQLPRVQTNRQRHEA